MPCGFTVGRSLQTSEGEGRSQGQKPAVAKARGGGRRDSPSLAGGGGGCQEQKLWGGASRSHCNRSPDAESEEEKGEL